jgi:hypothetical protein
VKTIRLSLLAAVALCCLFAAGCALAGPEKVYFAIEIDGVLCGYSEAELSHAEENGRRFEVLKQYVTTMIQALAAEVTSEARLTYYINHHRHDGDYHSPEICQPKSQTRQRHPYTSQTDWAKPTSCRKRGPAASYQDGLFSLSST